MPMDCEGGAAFAAKGIERPTAHTIGKMTRAPPARRRPLEITGPRIASFPKCGNEFCCRSRKFAKSCFWRCPIRPGKINSRRLRARLTRGNSDDFAASIRTETRSRTWLTRLDHARRRIDDRLGHLHRFLNH